MTKLSDRASGLGKTSRMKALVAGLTLVGILTICLWLSGIVNSSATLTAYATAMLTLGTIGLAIGTVGLYIEQRKDLDVAKRQEQIASKALEASIRPWLTHTNNLGSYPGVSIVDNPDESIQIRVRLRNIGNGLAIISPRTAMLGINEDLFRFSGEATSPVVGSQEVSFIQFEIDRMDPDRSFAEEIAQNKVAVMRLTYVDAAGGQATTLVLRMHSIKDQIQVAVMRYFNGSDIASKPFAETDIGQL